MGINPSNYFLAAFAGILCNPSGFEFICLYVDLPRPAGDQSLVSRKSAACRMYLASLGKTGRIRFPEHRLPCRL
jgi:hypothetical protein